MNRAATSAARSTWTGSPPAVLEMPFDLLRHDMLVTLQRVPGERITAIVDDLFLPLVTGTCRR
jgi:hypothetical protein